jgi:hypothetical protein
MRTSITLDEDIYQLASAYAAAKGITLGAAVGELVRKGENLPDPPKNSSRLKMNKYGYIEIVGGDVLTPEKVKELSEDEIA